MILTSTPSHWKLSQTKFCGIQTKIEEAVMNTAMKESNFCTSTSVTNTYILDVLWGQPIKLAQVVSTSEFHEY